MPNLLPEDADTLYFITICVDGRKPLLANEMAWAHTIEACADLNRWMFPAIVLMPDHLHFLAGPVEDRGASVSQMLKWFKTWFNRRQPQPVPWQEGGFDRLFRSGESAMQKWHYMRENPVRAGLVQVWTDWPYSKGFREEDVI